MIFFSYSKKHCFLNLFAVTKSAVLFTNTLSFLLENVQAVFGALRLSYSMDTGDKAAGTLSRPIACL
jgi:hypothetical protein